MAGADRDHDSARSRRAPFDPLPPSRVAVRLQGLIDLRRLRHRLVRQRSRLWVQLNARCTSRHTCRPARPVPTLIAALDPPVPFWAATRTVAGYKSSKQSFDAHRSAEAVGACCQPACSFPFRGVPELVRRSTVKILLRSWKLTTGHLMQDTELERAKVSEIIEMALSDETSFSNIRAVHGLSPDAVKALMRRELKPGSYRAWRKRVRQFSDRREIYK